jgi:hypothetical protein
MAHGQIGQNGIPVIQLVEKEIKQELELVLILMEAWIAVTQILTLRLKFVTQDLAI